MDSEISGLKKQLAITIKRLNALREDFAMQSDANLRFTLKMQINRCEQEIEQTNQQIQEAYGLGVATYVDSTLMHTKIKELDIDLDLGELYLVNCDRHPSTKRFWDRFDEKKASQIKFQFYFILACPTQQPNSFSERMVYEMIFQELDEELDALDYQRKGDSRRLRMENLPQGRNLRNSIKDFKKYFARRFDLDRSRITFEDYIETGLPKMAYEYIATVFDLNASKWKKGVTNQFLQWMIDVFSNTHQDVPTFLFFFPIFLKNAHLPGANHEILQQIKTLIDKNKDHCSLITPLPPVDSDQVEDWFRDIGEHNQAKIADMLRTFVFSLPDDKKQQYQTEGKLDMCDIERLQEMIYLNQHH